MALSLVADSGEKVSSSASSYTYSFTPGVCDFLYTIVLTEGQDVTATYNSNALSVVAGAGLTFNLYQYIFRSAVDPSATAHNIVITPTSGSQGYLTRTMSLLGVNRSSPDGATYTSGNFANAVSPFTSSSIVTAVGDWVLCVLGGLTDQTITADAAQANAGESILTYHLASSTLLADAASETFAYTYSASMFRGGLGLVVQAAGAAPPATNVMPRAGRRFSRARHGGGRVSF